MTEIVSVNQRVQIGAESTAGTAVPAAKLLNCFDFQFGVNAATSEYTPTGSKYVATVEEDTEYTDITVGGNLDYNGLPYLLSSTMGIVAPVAHGVSAVAKDWPYIPPVSGSIAGQTYTLQQGDAVRARSFANGLLSMFGYKGTRKSPFTISGKGFGQPLSDGITLTASPTAVALAQAVAKEFNVYLDTTSAGLGTTLLTRVFSVDYAFDSVYGPFFALSRATVGFSGTADLKPKCSFKMLMAADSNGFGAMQGYLQNGTILYLRVEAIGSVIDNLQTVALGSPSAGDFTLTYKGQTTATIAFDAAASAVQSALALLSTIPSGDVAVTGSAGGPYSVIFSGSLAQDTTAMTGSGAGLTGGTFAITQNQSNNAFTHDMAVKVAKPNPFKDEQGVFANEWELTVVQDPTWASGQAQKITVTNLISAL